MDQTNRPELPKVMLDWDSPTLNTNSITLYIVEYDGQVYITNKTSFEIDLQDDLLFVNLYVSVLNDASKSFTNGTRSNCSILSTLERRTCKLLKITRKAHCS